MRLIDTNVIVHALDDDSPKQERAKDVLTYYIGTGEAVISLHSIIELYSALTKWQTPQEAKISAERTLLSNSFKKIKVDEESISEALSLAEKNKLRRSEVFDALLAATAKRNGIDTVLTDNPKHFKDFGLKVETLETATLSGEF